MGKSSLYGFLDRQKSYDTFFELKVLKREIIFAYEKTLCLVMWRCVVLPYAFSQMNNLVTHAKYLYAKLRISVLLANVSAGLISFLANHDEKFWIKRDLLSHMKQ